MKLKLDRCLKIKLLFGLLVSSFAMHAQNAHTPGEVHSISTIDSIWVDSFLLDPHHFDRRLVPSRGIYGDSWDSLNVDSPFFDKKRIANGFYLDLSEEGCQYVHPFKGVVTSGFGWRWGRMHKGIDIDLRVGDPVVAAFDGVVRIVKYDPYGFGNYILIRHYNGLETIYAHLSESIVKHNQFVRAGEVIGYGGNTGRSTGSHLHFETRLLGQAFDPTRIIDFNAHQLKHEQVFINHTWFPYISTSGKSVTPVSSRVYHKIRSGDTLYGLSRRYGVSVNQICRLNGISRNTILRIGRTLRIR